MQLELWILFCDGKGRTKDIDSAVGAGGKLEKKDGRGL